MLTRFKRFGVLNADTLDLSVLATSTKPAVQIAFCSSDRCAGQSKSSRGTFVMSGRAVRTLTHCPVCRSTALYFTSTSPERAEKLEDQLKEKRKNTQHDSK